MKIWNLLDKEIKPPKEINLTSQEEEGLRKLSDEELRAEGDRLKKEAIEGGELDDLLPRAFALVREASHRISGERHFDVQLWGGLVLHRGGIAEMQTGEGKTLSATTAVYLNALTGKGVHVVTVNDYLAERDAVWMGKIYHFLGLSVSCLIHEAAYVYDPAWKAKDEGLRPAADQTEVFLVQKEYLRPVSRREAYETDVTYGTNHEFGFDYLRDNLASGVSQQVQRGHYFAVIDEIDSILIDEARTPLIISAPDVESSQFYKLFAKAVERLAPEEDYLVDEKTKSVEITQNGIDKIEGLIGLKDLYSVENLKLVRYLESSLKAKALFVRDRDYVVRNGEIVIVDQFTGRLMLGRRYSAGLHQAIEAKEGVLVKEESRIFAQISIQNYFRLYEKLSGMTGTAQTSAEEFHKVYGLEVVTIPTNKPMIRKNMPDLVFRNLKGKYRAIAKEVKERNQQGQPVLIGTTSIEKNETLAGILASEGIRFEILNAKNNEREGAIIAQAGRRGSVTLATNMAGRGVDIILGGNPGSPKEAEEVKELGGLHVIGTERHEARRIDNQLRGRSGRQGDPGSSRFFLSLEDDLLRIFGGDRLKSLMERLDVPEETPIESKLVSGAISQAQARVEGLNFDARKYLLEYDDVLNKQRLNFYRERQKVLGALNKEELKTLIKEAVNGYLGRLEKNAASEEDLRNFVKEASLAKEEELEGIGWGNVRELADEKVTGFGELGFVGRQILGILDFLWMNHLEDIESLTESVRIRAYGQRDPLIEYRQDSHRLYEELKANFDAWVFNNIFKIAAASANQSPESREVKKDLPKEVFKNVGRNDLCPCGSGKKFKKCHGIGN
ncbi:MAG TPA: preprotein translocase subunit SecA [Candidatus Tyrphobacter sp.]|nr:preprotein translocase subunit SecA [Candidatus Tyrphobacter sp.]